jgi:uncharacterized protein (DUF302 family)
MWAWSYSRRRVAFRTLRARRHTAHQVRRQNVMREFSYGFGATVPLPYADAVRRTREALAGEGFGVLTEIDVSETLRQKLDVEFQKYVILGACNPALAHRALSAEIDLGLLLPCNVVVREAADDSSVVSIMDPEAALSLAQRPEIAPIAAEVKTRLRRVLQAITD